MARGLGLTALRVALGGLSGVGQDRAAMREAQRVEQEQARALERQRMLDRSMLQREGYEETGIMDQLRAGGREATFRTVFGPPEQRRPGDARAVAAALESAMPRQTITMDGQQFERTSPRALELRQAEQEQMRERNKAMTQQQEGKQRIDAAVEAARKAGVDPEKFRAAIMAPPGLQGSIGSFLFQRPSGERQMTPGQQQAIRDEEAEAEAAFNTAMQRDSPFRQALVTSYRAMRAARPNARPQELMRAALAAARSMRIPFSAKISDGDGDELERDARRSGVDLKTGAQRSSPAPVARQAPADKPAGMSAQELQRRVQQAISEGYSEEEIQAYLSALRDPNY